MFFKSWYVDVFIVVIFSFIFRINKTYYSLFKRLIYEIQNNLRQLTTHMLTLIIWHNRFSENENEAVETHIPRHRDSKTKKPQHRDSKAEKPRHRDSKTKSHDIEFPRNSDPYAPRYSPDVSPILFFNGWWWLQMKGPLLANVLKKET